MSLEVRFSIVSKSKNKLNKLLEYFSAIQSEDISLSKLKLTDYAIYASLSGVLSKASKIRLLEEIAKSDTTLVCNEDFLLYQYENFDNIWLYTDELSEDVIIADGIYPFVEFTDKNEVLAEYVKSIVIVEFMSYITVSCSYESGISINEEALQKLLEYSKKYPTYDFYITGFDKFADNLPEVGTILSEDISNEEFFKIDADISGILSDIAESHNLYLFDGYCSVPIAEIDKTWFFVNASSVTIRNGEVIERK